jgi:hypothetical protein
MDPKQTIREYLADAKTLHELVCMALGQNDFAAAASIQALLGKTIADAGQFCASLIGDPPAQD